MLEARDVVRAFGGVQANNGVTISVMPGEIRGIIGPNGSGKSTFCNLLSGIYPPSSGEVWFGGERIDRLSLMRRSRKGLLRTYQVPRLFANMTVEDNLRFAYAASSLSRLRRTSAIESRKKELLDRTGLAPKKDLLAGSLSGGQKALLQLAQCFIVPEARCYILDEPTAGINPVIRDSIIDLLREKNERDGATFIIVSHEMYLIRKLSHSVTVLAEGKVLTEGTLDEVLAKEQVIDAYIGRRRTQNG